MTLAPIGKFFQKIKKGENTKNIRKTLVLLVFFCFIIVGYIFSLGNLEGQGKMFWTKKAQSCMTLEGSEQVQCLDDLLKGITESEGIKVALGIIEPLSQQFTYLLQWSHPFAHSIGGYGLAYYAKQGVPLESQIGRALVDCDGYGAFGCYHGAIEVGLSYLSPEDRARVIRKACMEDPLIQSAQYFVNQCLHWFGHGLAVFTYNTLEETLAMCDGLNEEFNSDEVQLCLSGVFHAGSVPGESDEKFLHNVANVWKEGDPYYPCLDIEEKFRGHCYSHAAGRTLSSDLEINFKTCDDIPEPDPIKKLDYVERCYDSAANTLLAQTLMKVDLTNEEKVKEIVSNCKTYARDEYRPFCYAGAARYWVLRDPLLNNINPFEICKKVEENAKPACYANIGFGNNENYYSEEKLREYCNNSEPKYRGACLEKS